MIFTKTIHIKGLVQGVGFRPFIYKHSIKHNLFGWVENRNDGVFIKIEGKEKNIKNFLSELKSKAPIASQILSIETKDCANENFSDFSIKKSESISEEITEISPDIAVCEDCMQDVKSQKNRINYPFTNCTNCGPRFTIIKDLPYDRKKTTMEPFVMCENCKEEYTNILDRRFHAQPVACSICGPEYELILSNKRIKDFSEILETTQSLINKGKIVTIKGIGGFFMACDANNENAVKKLRELKHREKKPFAVMFSDIDSVKKHCYVNKTEEESLLSWRRPIVLLKNKKELAKSVSSGFNRTGVMLPYMPIHYLIFNKLNSSAIVLTSGNITDEPIIIDNKEAEENLLPISDALLVYNRDIYNRVDDSIEININNIERIIRRSRGYTPSPIHLSLNTEGIFAAGAELVNSFCIGKGKQAIISQHIGDIKDYKTYAFYTESITRFKQLFRLNVDTVVHDLHQDYFSTKYALETNKNAIAVQHHHAHIASCMAEHGLDEKVIGIAMDGTGMGSDNKIWGGEFFIASLSDFERYTHFDYIPLPGGDKVTKEPWRTAVSFLYKVYGRKLLELNLPFLENINKQHLDMVILAIEKNINCPESSSAGRLFDAVAALTNICTISNFHAEAPMRLENVISEQTDSKYDIEINNTISFNKTIKAIVKDINIGVSNSIISVKFHNTIIHCINEIAIKIRNNKKINKVVLSGGSFQNAYILEKTEQLLEQNGFNVYSHNKVPTNDAGIALGQLIIAAKQKQLNNNKIKNN